MFSKLLRLRYIIIALSPLRLLYMSQCLFLSSSFISLLSSYVVYYVYNVNVHGESTIYSRVDTHVHVC